MDQGQGETCTIYALANATALALQNRNIRVNPVECLGALKQIPKVDVSEGNYVEDFHGEMLRNMTDDNDGQYRTILLNIKRVNRLQMTGQHVLVYNRIVGDSSTKHCVFVQRYQKVTNEYVCLNSWGEYDQIIRVDYDQSGNVLYCVNPLWLRIDSVDFRITDNSKLTSTSETNMFFYTIKILTFGIFGRVVHLFIVMRKTANNPLVSFFETP